MMRSSNQQSFRHIQRLCLLLLTIPSYAHAFPSFRPASPPSAPSEAFLDALAQQRETIVDSEALGLTSAERRLIFRSERSLASYSRRSDCSNAVATSLQKRCGDELEDSDDERIRAAIALTKCDLATAGQTPPLECSGIQPSQGMGVERNPASPCVAALSRSPQHWSTYSGYLREIPMLCFALRRQLEVDTVREIYVNISQEKISILKVLKKGAEGALQRDQDQEVKLAEFIDHMKTATYELNKDLFATVRSIRMVSQEVTDLVQSSRASEEFMVAVEQVVALAQERIEQAASKTSKDTELHLSKSLDPLLARLAAEQSLALADSATHFASRLDTALDSMRHRFDDAVKQLYDSLGPVKELSSIVPQSQMMMDQVWSSFKQVVDSVSPLLTQVDKLSDLQNELSIREQVRATNLSALLDRIEVAHTRELDLYARREEERSRVSMRPMGLVEFMTSLLLGDTMSPHSMGEGSISKLGSIDDWRPSIIGHLLRTLPLSSPASIMLLRGCLTTLIVVIKVAWSALCLMLVSTAVD
ncbi:hypothetical protein BCV69DRAFT_89183 [Microstroma glucosiphilum]|uniref:Karyogamy protein 5 n=1 Tax=Pseudomicrostroma glucosiphilum TaxID=1684307 RepID=A0A316TZ37_9BASI|nr:hypothetical protein BCV69DRAFT_89183 [Pseudomicrostroma glucosiphilum]PWN17948.1 hypothetical protein BCV69DRAFT_89183 [Pseudomicrostroma glucosiphilum]